MKMHFDFNDGIAAQRRVQGCHTHEPINTPKPNRPNITGFRGGFLRRVQRLPRDHLRSLSNSRREKYNFMTRNQDMQD